MAPSSPESVSDNATLDCYHIRFLFLPLDGTSKPIYTLIVPFPSVVYPMHPTHCNNDVKANGSHPLSHSDAPPFPHNPRRFLYNNVYLSN